MFINGTSDERFHQYNRVIQQHSGLLPLQVYSCFDGSEFKVVALTVADGFKVLTAEKPDTAARWVKQSYVDEHKAYHTTFGNFQSEIRKTTLRGI